MSAGPTEIIPGPFPRLMHVLMYPALLLPIAGWIASHGIAERITHVDAFTGAGIHELISQSFAVIFLLSMIINVTLISFRYTDRPLSLTKITGFPLWELLLIVISGWWVFSISIATDDAIEFGEILAGLGIAGISIVIFVLALRHDPRERVARRARLQARRAAESLKTVRQLEVRAWGAIIVWIVVLAACLATWASVQLPVVIHPNCEVNGYFYTQGTITLSSTNCGDFQLDGNLAAAEAIGSDGSYDIVTRGYDFGFPPLPHIVELTRVQ